MATSPSHTLKTHIIDTHVSSRFPIELVLHITHLAALPEFSPERKVNPYACALKLCLTSGAMRRIAMPLLLHTIVLTRGDAQAKFVRALRIQKDYASTRHPLFIDYTHYVRRVWIGEHVDPPRPPSAEVPSGFSGTILSSLRRRRVKIHADSDLSILAPVLLGAPSLGIDFPNISVLCNCLKWAWRNQTTAVPRESLHVGSSSSYSCTMLMTKLPWRTTTLTFSGNPYSQWDVLTSTTEGSAFLAHIPSLVLLGDTSLDHDYIPRIHRDGYDPREVPGWARGCIPRFYFRRLRNVTVPVPKDHRAYDRIYTGGYTFCLSPGPEDIKVEMLTVEAPSDGDLTRANTNDWVEKGFDAYLENGEGILVRVEVGTQVQHTNVIFDWETCWTNGYIG